MQAYRPDIDGLRAIAVTSVVFYHALPGLVPSGFVGVDIFFAISGYLIGGIIYAGATGKGFSFLNFYARRARRILPALIVVVLATLAAGFLLLRTLPFLELTGQAISALAGFSNVYFWDNTDYFSDASIFQPLMMTWSLGVEEQFYVVFPFVIFAILRFPAKWHIALMGLLVAVSLAISVYTTAAQPIAAFYLMPSRAWELAAGAALAIAHKRGTAPSLRAPINNVLATIGLALTLGSLAAFNHDTAFPGYAALMPIIGTLILIQTQTSWINRHLLSLAPVVFIGLISYSWYLWHWPLMSYVHIVSDFEPRPQVMFSVVALSFVLAVLSWRFVEQPFRKSGARPRTTLLRYGAGLSFALAIPVALRLGDGWPERLPEPVRVAEAIQMEGRGTCLEGLGKASLESARQCRPEAAEIALFGDSHASAAGPGLMHYAKDNGLTLAQFSKSACTPLLGFGTVHKDHGDHARACARFLETQSKAIAADPDIKVVVIVGFWPFQNHERLRPLVDGKLKRSVKGVSAHEQGLSALVRRFTDAGKRVVLVGDVPRFNFNPMRRIVGDNLPLRAALRDEIDPARDIGPETVLRKPDTKPYQRSRQIVAEIAAANPMASYLDLEAQLCADGRCRFAEDGKPLFYDYHHLSAFGSRQIDWSSVLDPLLNPAPSRNGTP